MSNFGRHFPSFNLCDDWLGCTKCDWRGTSAENNWWKADHCPNQNAPLSSAVNKNNHTCYKHWIPWGQGKLSLTLRIRIYQSQLAWFRVSLSSTTSVSQCTVTAVSFPSVIICHAEVGPHEGPAFEAGPHEGPPTNVFNIPCQHPRTPSRHIYKS